MFSGSIPALVTPFTDTGDHIGGAFDEAIERRRCAGDQRNPDRRCKKAFQRRKTGRCICAP